MKIHRPIVVTAALALATLIGSVTGGAPASAATSVAKEACTVVTRQPFKTNGIVGATAVVTCSRARWVYVQQNMREWDGSWTASDNIGTRNSGWVAVPAGQSRAFTIYTSCRNTEIGNEEFYQAGRLAISGYDANRYSPWAASYTSSISC